MTCAFNEIKTDSINAFGKTIKSFGSETKGSCIGWVTEAESSTQSVYWDILERQTSWKIVRIISEILYEFESNNLIELVMYGCES